MTKKKIDENIKRCGLCDEFKIVSEFPTCSENFLFHKNGFYAICYDCLASKINAEDLDTINKMCQILDIGFYADTWIKMYNTYKDLGNRAIVENYVNKVKTREFCKSQWQEENLLWEKARECNSVMNEMTTLRGELFIFLKKKWGAYEEFSVEDYIRMESYEKHTLNYYNFRDEARRDLIRKMALVSVLIDKKLATGDTKEMTSLITSYQSLMRESGIQNTISNDTETITSISELMAYLEKTGWMVDYKVTESRDIVDSTIINIQRYLNRLVSDSAETVHTNYETEKMEMESGTKLNEEDIQALLDSDNSVEELENEEMLSSEELLKMFAEISNEYNGSK